MREAALTWLYRLLFVLYAEDRDLIPTRQRRDGLWEMRREVAGKRTRRRVSDRRAIGRVAGKVASLNHQSRLPAQRRDGVQAAAVSFRAEHDVAGVGRKVRRAIRLRCASQLNGLPPGDLLQPQIEIAGAIGGEHKQLPIR